MSSNNTGYSTLHLQLKQDGGKLFEAVIDPQGPISPVSLRNESRRANDGYFYIGSNKFDRAGRQVNDLALDIPGI